MKILYLEDSGSAMYKVDYLKEIQGHEVWVTNDYRDVMSWLEFEPGEQQFDAIIFDLVMLDETLPYEFIDEQYNKSVHKLPSLFFIRYYVLKKFPHIRDKIILCSSFFDSLDNYTAEIWDDIGKLKRIDKRAQFLIEKLTSMLKDMEA